MKVNYGCDEYGDTMLITTRIFLCGQVCLCYPACCVCVCVCVRASVRDGILTGALFPWPPCFSGWLQLWFPFFYWLSFWLYGHLWCIAVYGSFMSWICGPIRFSRSGQMTWCYDTTHKEIDTSNGGRIEYVSFFSPCYFKMFGGIWAYRMKNQLYYNRK